eukprot:TRINITY_DN799_c1_g1_i3.p3 TRINITY_DN799_c1_g1~~TRINITY_DN799_c1_g1_i3.p3  ORF type:complete len:112 (-),score=16.00 TRINITY_DN799_c1_g1_i3:378-713(-)
MVSTKIIFLLLCLLQTHVVCHINYDTLEGQQQSDESQQSILERCSDLEILGCIFSFGKCVTVCYAALESLACIECVGGTYEECRKCFFENDIALEDILTLNEGQDVAQIQE